MDSNVNKKKKEIAEKMRVGEKTRKFVEKRGDDYASVRSVAKHIEKNPDSYNKIMGKLK